MNRQVLGGIYAGAMARKSDGKKVTAVAERLVLTRQALGLSQLEFARSAHLAPNTYNQYETGRNRPNLESAIALCDAYSLTLDWIYRGDASGLPYRLAEAIKSLRGARDA